jgi:hypothetical protein
MAPVGRVCDSLMHILALSIKLLSVYVALDSCVIRAH